MKSKCPKCIDGCDKCDGTGYMPVSFAEGDWFTRLCLNPQCQFVNGGSITNGFPSYSSGPCIICEGNTEWVSMNDPKLDNLIEPAPWIANQHKYQVKRLQKDIDSLLARMNQIREFAKSVPGYGEMELTVEQAKLMGVCRICKSVSHSRVFDNKPDPFVMNYGAEHAHQSCLDKMNRSV